MTALGMRLQLSRLRKSHGLAEIQPTSIALAPPSPYAQILEGYAATTTVDLARQKFRGWAFGNIRHHDPPPLYFKHQQERGEIGTITSLEYDSDGALIIRATVTDPVARRCNAFSVCCTVVDYEIVNADTPDFYSLIRYAILEEISLTPTPANPHALVTHRRDVCARAKLYGAAQQHIEVLKKYVTLIQELST